MSEWCTTSGMIEGGVCPSDGKMGVEVSGGRKGRVLGDAERHDGDPEELVQCEWWQKLSPQGKR